MRTKEFHGERLKTARLLRGKTLTDLSLDTNISKQSLSLYENNRNKPDYEKINIISRALSFPQDFFLHKDADNTKTEVTYFRSLTSATKLDRTAQSLKLEFVAKMYEVLSDYIDFPPLNIPSISFNTSNLDFDNSESETAIKEIEYIANTVREYWGLGDAPIQDLQYILEKNGIVVTGFNTNADKIDAFSQHTYINNNEIFFICVDQGTKPEGRIAFDLAHELGHILLHPWSESLDLITKEEFKLRERQANMFASAFLLPKNSFSNDVKAFPTDLKYYLWLKKKWKTSIQAMIFRSHQLGIITANQYQYMMRQISKKGWRLREPDDTPYYLHENIFQGAIDVLIEARVLSASSIIQAFVNDGINMYISDIEDLLCLRKGTLTEQKDNSRIIHIKPFLEDTNN